ncbi:hypothetical protein CDAR_89451 [Caerostris darwini]|uniref:Uncharacterized protein n=1 Tax=Caerostris darwini TaxID=1538125 RepID=A0AAV4N2N5_9ARAC|nr:hypothetical protein CDAR_89451 [Caerostris darwini]
MDFASSSWMITKNCDSVSSRDNPRRDNLQQSRIFIQRNGLCFLQLDDFKNCDSVSNRDNPKKDNLQQAGSSFKEMDFASSAG